MLTITPYSPWLNPVETFISSVKNKLRKTASSGRVMSLSAIENAVDSSSEGDPLRLYSASRKETLMVIQKLQKSSHV